MRRCSGCGPLRTYETIGNLISNTTNCGGLLGRARRRCLLGKKVSAEELRELKIEPDNSTESGTT